MTLRYKVSLALAALAALGVALALVSTRAERGAASTEPVGVSNVGAGTVAHLWDGRESATATPSPSVLGEAQVGLTARMDAAVAAGAYSITCEPGDGRLVCVPVADADVVAALRRGETVYGRTVIGFPGGAKVAEDVAATFETTDLVCTDASGDSLQCLSVTEVEPAVRAGAETFVFYKKHNVTFDKNGIPVGHVGEGTVPLRVVAAPRRL